MATSHMGVFDRGAWSVEAKWNQRRAYERRVAKWLRVARGPYLENGEIFIRSPRRDGGFIAVMRRWGFKWDGQYWHRPTTAGKEHIALEWARDLYLDYFSEQWQFCAFQVLSHGVADRYPEIAAMIEFAASRGLEPQLG